MESPLWEHFNSQGRLAPHKALTLHRAVNEGNIDTSLSRAIPSGDRSGVVLHAMSLPEFTPEQGGKAEGPPVRGMWERWHWEPRFTSAVANPACVLDGRTDYH